MFDDIARVTEKIIKELNEKDSEKFAIDFAQKLTGAGIKVTKIYGPSVGPVNVCRTEFKGVQLDFSEHDKKVYGEAEKRFDEVRAENHALRKQVEELKKQNTDIQNSHMKLYNDSKDEIRELKAEIEKLRKICREKQHTITKKSEQINELYKKYEPIEDSIERFGIKFSTIDGIPMFSFKLRGEEVNPAIIIAENDELKAEIRRLREKCSEVPADTAKESGFTINKENATISLPYEDFITHCSEKAFEEIKKGHWTGVVIKTAEEIKNLPFGCKRTEDLLSELVSYEKMPSPRKTTKEEDEVDFESLCKELQDQHQQDCITINQLHVTIDKLVDRYANLRKNAGMD